MPAEILAPEKDAAPSYENARPVFVIDDLAELRGPRSGVVTLPVELDWSPRRAYDLGESIRVINLYRTVLREAASDDDLRKYLDRNTLLKLWKGLFIPQAVRHAWEQKQPELNA